MGPRPDHDERPRRSARPHARVARFSTPGFFGALWGIGGLTFGLTMRYLGMSLGMGVALGFCAAFGTLVPRSSTGSSRRSHRRAPGRSRSSAWASASPASRSRPWPGFPRSGRCRTREEGRDQGSSISARACLSPSSRDHERLLRLRPRRGRADLRAVGRSRDGHDMDRPAQAGRGAPRGLHDKFHLVRHSQPAQRDGLPVCEPLPAARSRASRNPRRPA
jgi:hypothetical protein